MVSSSTENQQPWIEKDKFITSICIVVGMVDFCVVCLKRNNMVVVLNGFCLRFQ